MTEHRMTVVIEGTGANTAIWSRRYRCDPGATWVGDRCISCGGELEDRPALVVRTDTVEAGVCSLCMPELALVGALQTLREHLRFTDG